MSFEKIDQCDHKVIHERSCVILYHFTAQELRLIQNAARMTGIKDMIAVTPGQADTMVKEILDNEMKEGKEGIKEKAIIFNSIPSTRMNAFIDALKKCRMRRPLMAVVTENSINWSLSELIGHLMEERNAVNNQQFSVHE